jgi:hypothetical protein
VFSFAVIQSSEWSLDLKNVWLLFGFLLMQLKILSFYSPFAFFGHFLKMRSNPNELLLQNCIYSSIKMK